MRFIALEKLHRLHDGFRAAVSVEGRNLLLLQDDGQIHIIDNYCPHAGARLDRASIRGGEILCPWHGMAFRLDSGKGTTCGLELVKYNPVFEGQQVGILL
ncbi:MAG TPA: Rieske (2Fe-2S) protein [Pseudomonadales bacterium]|nr:Rieske (2Fe-2S) protein [Pseudomonadales bacterium]